MIMRTVPEFRNMLMGKSVRIRIKISEHLNNEDRFLFLYR